MATYEGYEQINTITGLDVSWEGKTESEVEDFITRELKKAEDNNIIGMSYENSILTLTKKNGEPIKTSVTVETPEYKYGLYIYGVKLDNDNSKVYTELSQEIIM